MKFTSNLYISIQFKPVALVSTSAQRRLADDCFSFDFEANFKFDLNFNSKVNFNSQRRIPRR